MAGRDQSLLRDAGMAKDGAQMINLKAPNEHELVETYLRTYWTGTPAAVFLIRLATGVDLIESLT